MCCTFWPSVEIMVVVFRISPTLAGAPTIHATALTEKWSRRLMWADADREIVRVAEDDCDIPERPLEEVDSACM